MKLVSLNIWHGNLNVKLLKFIKNESKSSDIFCFQEVYHTTSREQKYNLFQKISKVLPGFYGFFSSCSKVPSSKGVYDGLAIFLKKSIKPISKGKLSIYFNKKYRITHESRISPRILQYIQFNNNNKKLLLVHFHGIWHPKTKVDSISRIRQSRIIRKFMDKFDCEKILCGDFNLLPKTRSLKILENGMRNLIIKFRISTTRNKYYPREEKFADYALVSQNIVVKKFDVPKIWVSDHLPLRLQFE